MSAAATMNDTTAASQKLQHPPQQSTAYAADILPGSLTITGIAAACLGGGLFTLISWLILKTTHLPAFGGSMVSRAISTTGTVAVIVITALLVHAWLRDEHPDRTTPGFTPLFARSWWRKNEAQNTDQATTDATIVWDADRIKASRPIWRIVLTYVVCYLSPAGLVVTTTAIPLSATKLYLEGITVDQAFRTQFLTRMTDQWTLTDMNYIGLPTFYPAGWFWWGGRFGNLLGLDGWEVFQPWALVSLSMAACIVVPVWQRLCGSLAVATGIGLVSVCIVLCINPGEPYSAIVALGIPAATVLSRRALDGHSMAIAGITLYLGLSACLYTLYTAVIAITVLGVFALICSALERSWRPVFRLALIAIGSLLIALVCWGPYLLALVRGAPRSGATATHYLPLSGTQVPLPMLSWSLIGGLCMIGLIFLIVRATDRDIRAMGLSLVIFYAWIVASMIATLAGKTLLGFRMDAVITIQLATAGVLCLADFRLVGVDKLYPATLTAAMGRTLTTLLVVVLAVSGIAYAQTIPQRNHVEIELAYSDTDGDGFRADLYPPDAGTYYAGIDKAIKDFGFTQPRDTVILTDEKNFLSYYPYFSFQAMTSHYANPLGEFDKRNAQIEKWATRSWTTLKDPTDFDKALSQIPWRSPNVIIFRGDKDDLSIGWKFDLAEDIYPNNPNVRFRGLFFNPRPFIADGTHWTVTQVGPFVVAGRNLLTSGRE